MHPVHTLLQQQKYVRKKILGNYVQYVCKEQSTYYRPLVNTKATCYETSNMNDGLAEIESTGMPPFFKINQHCFGLSKEVTSLYLSQARYGS